MLPGLGIYLAFYVYPALQGFRLSLYDISSFGVVRSFVGLDNFLTLLQVYPFSETYLAALQHNLFVFVLSSVTAGLLGLLLATLLSLGLRGSGVFKTIFFVPYILSAVVVGFLWTLILQQDYGVVNTLLRSVGLGGFARGWLGEPSLALPAIVLAGVWQGVGFPIVVFLAAIIGVPRDLVDAARVDGAGSFRTYVSVVYPLMRPVMLTMLGLYWVAAFHTFDLIFVMASVQGGPASSTDVLGLMFYRTAFGTVHGGGGNMGLAAAIAVTLVIIQVPVSFLVVYVQSRIHVEY